MICNSAKKMKSLRKYFKDIAFIKLEINLKEWWTFFCGSKTLLYAYNIAH